MTVNKRKSGILLPVTSLSSRHGIGCFSKEAYAFVDFLKEAGQSYWQVLPLGPTGYGDSPYQSFSTFAGNPYLIDLEELVERKWLGKNECAKVDWGSDKEKTDYEKVYNNRFKLLKKAYKKSNITNDKEYKNFVKKNAFWLEDYALFMAIKEKNKGLSYSEWDEDIRQHKKKAVDNIKKDPKVKDEAECFRFIQYLFFEQWGKLK
ncbi:MAG: 4-alpha-glucanotransferase, partial [Lachnospiraceae bacterium]|nr:4-alpha-glucanotransferase [Lachnospiraceae bacterium]